VSIYLSNYKKPPIRVVEGQTAGMITIDSLDATKYRTAKYSFTAEDSYSNTIYQCSFTVTHDSLVAMVTEFDVIQGDADIAFDAVYTDVVDNYPTKFRVRATFPTNFNGSWSLDKEVYLKYTDIQRDGFDGPSSHVYPGAYLYPNNS
jgi:hypothetical protein